MQEDGELLIVSSISARFVIMDFGHEDEDEESRIEGFEHENITHLGWIVLTWMFRSLHRTLQILQNLRWRHPLRWW